MKSLTYFYFITCLLPTIAICQVGIGTTNPQQELHIAGSNSTVRIEGLNSTNNANNNGLRNQAVYVNASGDLIVPATPAGAESIFNINNFLSSYQLQTGTIGQGNSAQIYQSSSFTLDQDALVVITYNINLSIRDRAGTGFISDGKPKLVQSYFYLGNGTTADFSTSFGRAGQAYTNSISPSSSEYIVTGFFHNTATEILFLSAGTYSIHLYGLVFASDGGSAAQSSDAFSCYYGSASSDYLRVVALY